MTQPSIVYYPDKLNLGCLPVVILLGIIIFIFVKVGDSDSIDKDIQSEKNTISNLNSEIDTKTVEVTKLKKEQGWIRNIFRDTDAVNALQTEIKVLKTQVSIHEDNIDALKADKFKVKINQWLAGIVVIILVVLFHIFIGFSTNSK